MKTWIVQLMWATLIAAGIAAGARLLHPATFTVEIVYGLLVVFAVAAIITVRHE